MQINRVRSTAAIIIAGLITFTLVTSPTHADQTGFAMTSPGNVGYAGDYSAGWQFTTNSAILITQLGYFDIGSSTFLVESHRVGIFDLSGNLLADATIPASGGTYDGFFSYVPLATPISLAANTSYVVAGTTGTTGNDEYAFVSVGTTDPAITYVQNLYGPTSGTTLVFPTINASGHDPGYFGGNFKFVIAGAPEALILSPGILTGGTSGMGTVTLTSSSTTATTVVLASSDTTAASVPASIIIPAGQTSGTFTVTTHTVVPYTPVTITATANGVSKSATLIVEPTGNPTFKLNPTSVIGGAANSTGTITVPGPAPAGGIPIVLSSNNPAAASVPASVTIPAGQTSVQFTVTTYSVTTNTSVVITASSHGTTGTATLTVRP